MCFLWQAAASFFQVDSWQAQILAVGGCCCEMDGSRGPLAAQRAQHALHARLQQQAS